jgi:hypothetical protein
MAEDELTITTTTDTADAVQSVAAGEEARRPSEFVTEELDGVSRESNGGIASRPVRALTYESPVSSRSRMQAALDEAEADLGQFATEQVTTNEPAGAEAQEPDAEILRAVREAAVADAVRDAREKYAREQQQAHLAPIQVELDQLRAEALPRFRARIEELTGGVPIKDVPNITFPDEVVNALLMLDGGAETTVYLGKHPQEARKLLTLPESVQVVKVAELSARLKPVMRGASRAPAPIRPIGGSATKSAVDIGEADYQTFKKRREADIRRRR